jgi:hypothetical protein
MAPKSTVRQNNTLDVGAIEVVAGTARWIDEP